jgi:uncharacterized lipoprotein YmbA
MMRRALPVLLLTLAACSLLSPQRDTSRFFTLSAVADGASAPSADGVAVGLGPVRVPGYLDRPELATRVATTELAFSPQDRWAEPLSSSLRRVLAQNLSALLGTDDVALFPWPVGTRVDWAVVVDFLRFERTPDGAVEVAARWIVREGAGGRIRAARETRYTERADGNDTPAVVEAWNKTLAALSRDIADGVSGLGPRDGGRGSVGDE